MEVFLRESEGKTFFFGGGTKMFVGFNQSLCMFVYLCECF